MEFESHPWLELIKTNNATALKQHFPAYAFMKFNHLDSLQFAILYAPAAVSTLYPLTLYQTKIDYDPLQFAYLHKKHNLYSVFYASFKKLFNDRTCLMQAVVEGDYEAIGVLLQYELYVVNSQQETALILALKSGKFDVAQLLQLEKGLGNWSQALDRQFCMAFGGVDEQSYIQQIQESYQQPSKQNDIIANYKQFELSQKQESYATSYVNSQYEYQQEKVKQVQLEPTKQDVKEFINFPREKQVIQADNSSDSVESIDDLSLIDQLHKENKALRRENQKLKKRISELEGDQKKQIDISMIANREPEIPLCLSKSNIFSKKQ